MKKNSSILLVFLIAVSVGAKDLTSDQYRRNSLCFFFDSTIKGQVKYSSIMQKVLSDYRMSDKFNDHNLGSMYVNIPKTYTQEEYNVAYPLKKQKSDNTWRSMYRSAVTPSSSDAEKKALKALEKEWEYHDYEVECEAKAIHFVKSQNVANLLIAKWFDAKEEKKDDSHYDVELIQARGAYNASELEKLRANESQRGFAALQDAGIELIPNTYVVITSFYVRDAETVMKESEGLDRDANMKTMFGLLGAVKTGRTENAYHGFLVEITTTFFKLNWDEQSENLFINSYYNAPLEKLLNSKEFSLQELGRISEIGISYTLPGKDNSDENLLKVAIYEAIDKVIAAMQKKNEDFRIKSPVIDVTDKGVTAFIGLKEGLEKNSKFEVLQREYNESKNRFIYKKVGNLKIDKNNVWDNRLVIEGVQMSKTDIKPNPNVDRTTLIGSGKFASGMLIRQTK